MVVIGTGWPPLIVDHEKWVHFALQYSQSSFAGDARQERWVSQGHLSPARQISGCQRGRKLFPKASSKKKKKEKRKKPVLRCLTNWLKATQTDAPKTWHTRLAYGRNFKRDVTAEKKVGNERQRWFWRWGKNESRSRNNKRQ